MSHKPRVGVGLFAAIWIGVGCLDKQTNGLEIAFKLNSGPAVTAADFLTDSNSEKLFRSGGTLLPRTTDPSAASDSFQRGDIF